MQLHLFRNIYTEERNNFIFPIFGGSGEGFESETVCDRMYALSVTYCSSSFDEVTSAGKGVERSSFVIEAIQKCI